MVGREAVATRIDVDIGDPERPVLLDDEAQEPMTVWQRPDACARFVIDPARDESLDDVALIDDPERGVLRAHEWTDLVDDDLEHLVDGEHAGDGPGRRIECVEDPERGLVAHEFAHLGRAYQRRRSPGLA